MAASPMRRRFSKAVKLRAAWDIPLRNPKRPDSNDVALLLYTSYFHSLGKFSFTGPIKTGVPFGIL